MNRIETVQRIVSYTQALADYAKDLEERLSTSEAMRNRIDTSYADEVAKLKADLVSARAPLERRIMELELKLESVQKTNATLVAEQQSIVKDLADLLEIPATTPGLGFTSLLIEARNLIEHSKQQFRDSI